MQKRYTKNHQRIMGELASLRKGRGISPAKMYNKSFISEAIAHAQGTHSSGLTSSQIHSLLLAEISRLPHTVRTTALRYAFSLAEEVKADDTLYQRRRKLAQMLGKHPDTIIRYENQAINELASQLELNRNTPAPSLEPHAVKDSTEATTRIMRDTATLNLAGLLPVANHSAELVYYLEQSQRPYLDVDIDIKFLPSSRGDNWYRLEARYLFMGVRDSFRLAIVGDSEDGERLLNQGLVDEFHKLNDLIDPTHEIRSIINSSRFTAHDLVAKSQKLFRFHELEEDQVNRLLRSVGVPLKGYCRFVEAVIPPEWQNKEVVYEYRNALNLRDDIHYAYWYAPSMMYVKKLTFDYSKFPNRESWNFVIMPFFGNIARSSVHGSHSLTIHPHSWIMPGHGLALMWESMDSTKSHKI